MRSLCFDYSNYVVSHVVVSFMVLRVSFRFYCTRGYGLDRVWDFEKIPKIAHELPFSTVVGFLSSLISWSGGQVLRFLSALVSWSGVRVPMVVVSIASSGPQFAFLARHAHVGC